MVDRRKLGRRSKQKGANFERWVSRELKPFFEDARRQPQSQIKQLKDIAKHDPTFHPCLTDVVAGPFGIECKHRKVLPNMGDTLEQAMDDCGTSGKVPVGVHKPHGGTVYDIRVAILYHNEILYMSWLEFIQNCARIKRERDSDRGPLSPGFHWETDPPLAD